MVVRSRGDFGRLLLMEECIQTELTSFTDRPDRHCKLVLLTAFADSNGFEAARQRRLVH